VAKKHAYKKEIKPKETETKPGEIPKFKSPAKSLWGKITIYIIAAAMILIPIISLIVIIIQNLSR
jgi:Fe2+ transport system protein B